MSSLLTLAPGFLKNDGLLAGMAKKLNISEDQVQMISVIAVPLLNPRPLKECRNQNGGRVFS